MSFISTRRVFSKPVRITRWLGFVFDAVFLVGLWVLSFSLPPLVGFGRGETPIALSSNALTVLMTIGIGLIRLSTYVAIIRRNRFPQRIEWILMLLGVGTMIFFMFFGGMLLSLWAGVHDYRRCPAEGVRNEYAVFAKAGAPCPPPGMQLRPV